MQQSSLVGHLPFALGLGIGALSSLRVYRGAQYLAQLRDKDIDRRRGQSCSQGCDSDSTDNAPPFFVLLPVYNNEGGVRDAHDYFSRRFGDLPRVSFLLITTERDVASDTPTVASELAASTANWHWLHSSRQPFCKASQLNDAVDWIRMVWGRGARLECVVFLGLGEFFFP